MKTVNKVNEKFKGSSYRPFLKLICLAIIVLSAIFISTDSSAQEQVQKIKNPDVKIGGCVEIGFDFDKGLYANWTGKAEVRYKQFKNKLKRYVRHNPDDKEAKEVLEFLENEADEYMPDYFQGDYDARMKINNIAEKDKKKKAWLEGSIGGKAMKSTDNAVARVKAYQFIKVYDEKAISKGYADANLHQPYDVGGFNLISFDINSAGGSASNTITIYNRPNGKAQAKVKAGAKMWALDGTKGWVRVTYVDDKGDLVWGYVLGPKVQEEITKRTGKPIPRSNKGKKKL